MILKNGKVCCNMCLHEMGEILTAKDIMYVVRINRYDHQNEEEYSVDLCGECARELKNHIDKRWGIIHEDV